MEYAPLHEAGFKDIPYIELNNHFVEPFENKSRREYLMNRFGALIDKFKEIGISAEIWIDGSFTTEKPEPGDIDIVIFVDEREVNNLSQDKQKILSDLNNRAISKIRYQCDVFMFPKQDGNLRSYWRGWFGFYREEQPKGIFRLFI